MKKQTNFIRIAVVLVFVLTGALIAFIGQFDPKEELPVAGTQRQSTTEVFVAVDQVTQALIENKHTGVTAVIPSGNALLEQLRISTKDAVVSEAQAAGNEAAVITIQSSSNESVYRIYESSAAKPLYIIQTPTGNYFAVSNAKLGEILSGTRMDVLYPNRVPPTLKLSGTEIELSAHTYDWRHIRLNRQTTSSTQTQLPDQPPVYKLTSGLPSLRFVCGDTQAPLIPDSIKMTLSDEKQTLFEGTPEEFNRYRIEHNGVYTLTCTAVWEQEETAQFSGTATYTWGLSSDSAPVFSVSSQETYSGEVLVLNVQNVPEDLPVSAENDFGWTPEFFRTGNGYTALLPVSYRKAPGEYALTLKAGEQSKTFSVTVVDKDWQTQNLVVDETTSNDTIYNNDANTEWEQTINPLKKISDPTQYWQGAFTPPCSGAITTEFGMIRYTNGSPTSERHGGIDIAAKRGTPVLAPGNGRVLYAGHLKLTGNTVLIEHGYGLKTYYYHMDSLNVSADDMVEQGDQIGEVGSTGFSTGPHLHFAMSVGNVFVNPMTAYETAWID